MRTLIIITLLCLSCGTPGARLTPAEAANDTGVTEGPFDTLAAWRKYPGQPKTRHVRGYYRKDSTYVKEHLRSGR